MKRQRKRILLDLSNEELKSQLQSLIICVDSDSLTLRLGQTVLVNTLYKVHGVWFLRGELQ